MCRINPSNQPQIRVGDLLQIFICFRSTFADNSGKNLFDYKGVIIANPPKGVKDALEKAVDDAIECGAEEVVTTEDGTPEEQEGELKVKTAFSHEI